MDLSRRRQPGQPLRGRGEDGTAILEFTLVAILLFTIVFGIINFGLILSFKQDMTRAAAEGARAGAVASPASTALVDATAATEEAVDGFNQECGVDGMTCNETLHDCGVSTYTPTDPTIPKCVTVELVYNYETHPILAPVPLISAFMPDEIRAKSDARINP